MLLTLVSAFMISVLAMMSPGPDFAIVVRNSVRYGWRSALFTIFGIMATTLIHWTYVNLGLGALIAHSIVAFNILKYLAAAYLIFIGIKALRSKPLKADDIALSNGAAVSDRQAFMQGVITNILNPKAAMFWLSYFTIVLDPHMEMHILLPFIGLLLLSILCWFSLVAYFMSRARVRLQFLRLGHWFDRAMGAILIALGVKVALTTR